MKEQRSIGQTDTDIIVIDDMILNTDEMIFNGFFFFFNNIFLFKMLVTFLLQKPKLLMKYFI